MIHSSLVKPKIYPINGNSTAAQLDRIQDITEDITLNRTKRKEVGRDGKVDHKKGTPSARYTLRQFEYGNIDIYKRLSNSGDSDNSILLNDFKNSISDTAVFLTDDDGTYRGTIWLPKLRVAGFSLNLSDPEADIERSFDLVGEDYKILYAGNKYFIQNRSTVASGEASKVIDLSTYTPAENPDDAGKYMLKVTRYNGTTTVYLTETTDYTYSSVAKELTVTGNSTGDIITAYYSSASEPAGIWTDNDVDAGGIPCENASIYVSTSTYLYRIQSCTVDATLERFDIGEMGNSEKVKFGAKNKTVRITLGRNLEVFSLEEAMRGAGADYGILDAREFADDVNFYIRIYSEKAKTNHLLTYKSTACTPVSGSGGRPVDDYITQGMVLETDNLLIDTSEV